jgi:ABC-type branched-subunit amino acid transport system permease subunit
VSRLGRPTRIASYIYVALLSIGSIVAGGWAIRFIERRVGYEELLARAGKSGLIGYIVAYAPVALVAAGVIGVLLLLPFRRLQTWRFVAALLAAPLSMAALYGVHRWLVSYERGFYDRSSYTALYRQFCYPAIAATCVFVLVVALDLAVLRRVRARAATALTPR